MTAARAWLGGLLPALLLTVGAPARGEEARTPRLWELLAGARAVVVGWVVEVTPYDEGRLAVGRISVTRTIKGREPLTAALVVEMRDLPSVPPAVAAGESVVAFLVPAPRTSYLVRTLPAGTYWQPVRERGGVVVAADPAVVDEVADLLDRIAASSREPELDAAKRGTAERALVFDELAARHATVVEDGAASLAALPGLAASLDGGERARLEHALERTELPARVRVAVVRAVGRARLTALLPALARIPEPTAEVLEASWEARAELGAAPATEEVVARLKAPDPAVRSAAARWLVRLEGRKAIPKMAEVALSDDDGRVRITAIEALGRSGLPETLPPLEKAFADRTWEVRQAAGRAIFERGGRAAAEALARLAFEAPADAQAYAVTLLLALGVGTEDPLVRNIASTHPDDGVREIARHGVPFHEH